jgi:5-methylcytosine-specific restriction endonuclease McrA
MAAADPEGAKAYSHAHYVANRDRYRLLHKAYADAHRDELKAYRAAYYAAHKQEHNTYSSRWYRANRQKAQANDAARYRRNRQNVLAHLREVYQANPRAVKARVAAWRRANPDQYRAQVHTRRARKAAAGGKLSADIVARLFVLQRGRCACCGKRLGKKFHLDHIVSLARGGSNTDDNVQLLTQRCNNQKHAKDPIDFMRSRGKLL